jgi:tripartite-type tricarboxylate transporter receptor subunit TctC
MMRLSYRVVRHAALAFVASVAFISSAAGQGYPSRPVTVIVGFPPGGPTDTVARILADRMSKSLAQPVIVENVPGASGSIGGARVAHSKPDGYTLSIGNWSSSVGAGAMYPLTYHVMTDFEPVALLGSSYVWIVAKNELPAANFKEFVVWLKANPDHATAGSIGVGSAAQMCIVALQNETGTRFQIVPYKGGVAAVQDLLAGHIDFACPEASQTLPHVRTGKIKAMGIAAPKRWFAAPDVPTLAEEDVPGINVVFWHGLWAPKGTPQEIIGKLNAAVGEAFADPSVRRRLTDLGFDIPAHDELTPSALASFHKAELEKWWPIIKAAGLSVN